MAHATRLAQEVEFFDRWAKENAKHLEPVDGAVLDRYRRPGSLYPKEYCFRLLAISRARGSWTLAVARARTR